MGGGGERDKKRGQKVHDKNNGVMKRKKGKIYINNCQVKFK